MKNPRFIPLLSMALGLLLMAGLIGGCEDAVSVDGESVLKADRADFREADRAGMQEADPAATNSAVFANGAVETIASFDPLNGELPEGIAVDRRGNIYVSMSGLGEIWKLDSGGNFLEVLTDFPLTEGDTGVLGLRFDQQGTLYAAVSSTDADVNGVWKIAIDGTKERLAGTGGIVFPNDVEVASNGVVYISDSATGSVWRFVDGGPAEVWIQHETLEGTGAFGIGVPIGANGLAVVPGQSMPASRGLSGRSVGGVVVANSEKAQVVYVPILPDGSAGEPSVVSAADELFGIDGIAVDARGTIYGAVNVGNAIVRIGRGGVSEIASGDPLDFPASLAFGTGQDRHTLFIANFAIIHFLSDPPTPDQANPAVLSVRVGPPGGNG